MKERQEDGTNPFDESDEEKADFVPINVLHETNREEELDRNNPFFNDASDDEQQQVEAVQAEKAQTSGMLLRPNAEAIQG